MRAREAEEGNDTTNATNFQYLPPPIDAEGKGVGLTAIG